jgi:subtilisin family serine protease
MRQQKNNHRFPAFNTLKKSNRSRLLLLLVLAMGMAPALAGYLMVIEAARAESPATAGQDFAGSLEMKRTEAAKIERQPGLTERIRQLTRRAQEAREAQETEVLPVIVRIRAGFVPEGELSSPIEAEAQRFLIQEAQFRLLSQMTGYEPNSVKQFKYLPFVAMRVNIEGLESLLASSTVIDVQEDIAVPPVLAQSVALIGGTKAWAAGFTGAGQTVAVIDTGVDKTHPFLANKVVAEACYSTNASSQSLSSLCPGGVAASTEPGAGMPCGPAGSSCDHGTHVAGIVAGRGTNFSGVAKDATLIAIQAFTQVNTSQICGPGRNTCILAYDSDLVRGLERVYELRNTFQIAAVNMSLGGGRFSASCDANGGAMKLAIDLLRSTNIATVAAAGNNGYADSIGMPACISSAVSVGSTTDYSSQPDQVSSYSNSAGILNLLAPGEAINSAVPGGGFANWGGTSMATPHVAGAWAIARQKDPTASVTKILGALTSSGISITDNRNGLVKPRIQIDAALELLGDNQPAPTAPSAPTGLTAVPITDSRIDLAWTDTSSNETGFRIRRKVGNAGEWVVVATLGANISTWQNSELTAGTTYFYNVTAFNSSGESAVSNEAYATTPITPPFAPTNLVAAVRSASRVDLTWIDNSTNESGFRIERRTGTATIWEQIGTVGVNTTNFQNSGLSGGTAYYYRVFAFNAVGVSESSNISGVTTQPDDNGGGGGGQPPGPINLQGAAFSPSQVNLTWIDRSDNESGFRIRRKIGIDGSWSVIANVDANSTSFQNTGLSSGLTYYYQINAVNSSGESTPSNEVSVTVPNNTFIPLNNGLSARSNLLRNQTHFYQINVPIGATRLTILTTGTGNVDLFVRFGNQPQISIYNCRSINNSSGEQCVFSYPSAGDWHIMVAGYSNNISFYNLTATFQSGVQNELPAAPTNLSARANSTTQIGLNWTDNSSNELLFRIRRREESNGVWLDLPTVQPNVTSYVDNAVSPGVTYFYSVTSLNGAGTSASSNEVSISTTNSEAQVPAAPANLQATAVSPTQVNLTWADSSNNETGFRIQRRSSGSGSWTDATTVTQNTTIWQNNGLSSGQTYSYRVIAYNGTGDSVPSNEATATTPSVPVAPSNLQATLTSPLLITLNWSDNSNNENGFRIWRRIGSVGSFNEIASVGPNVTSYQNSGLTAGVSYFYRVTAINTFGESIESNEASATTPGVPQTPPAAPSGLTATPNSSSQVTLSWTDNSGNEAGFRLRRKDPGSSGWVEIATVGANVTNFQNTGLTASTSYVYQVTAYNSIGESAGSNEVDVTTLSQSSNSILLTNGRYSTGALPRNQSILYRIMVPANSPHLVVQTKGLGNADLYVRYGAQPQFNIFNCRSTGPTSSEQCTINRPTSGEWQIMVYGNTSSLSVFSVIASHGNDSSPGGEQPRR